MVLLQHSKTFLRFGLRLFRHSLPNTIIHSPLQEASTCSTWSNFGNIQTTVFNDFTMRTNAPILWNDGRMYASSNTALSKKKRRLPKRRVRERLKATRQIVKEVLIDVKSEGVKTIPNILTMSRIVLTPVIGYCVICNHFPTACGLFLYAGVTDVLDGYIARRFPSQSSSFGSFLDPLADKFLASVLDVVLIVAAFYIRYISLSSPITLKRFFDVTNPSAKLQPTFISKMNTAVQLALVAFTLAAPVWDYIDHIGLHGLWYLTAATTVGSGISYLVQKDTFKLLATERKRTLRRRRMH